MGLHYTECGCSPVCFLLWSTDCLMWPWCSSLWKLEMGRFYSGLLKERVGILKSLFLPPAHAHTSKVLGHCTAQRQSEHNMYNSSLIKVIAAQLENSGCWRMVKSFRWKARAQHPLLIQAAVGMLTSPTGCVSQCRKVLGAPDLEPVCFQDVSHSHKRETFQGDESPLPGRSWSVCFTCV